MAKAYDRMEWRFLESMIGAFGFAPAWLKLIMACVTTVKYSFLMNGSLVGPISPTRGLRQGDPLSPFLFILCAEGLSALIQQKERQGLIHGCKVARQAPIITHLFFADDAYLFFQASVQETYVMKQVLMEYEAASGQSINLQKSSLAFSVNVAEGVRNEVCQILQIQNLQTPPKYLGLPSLIGRKEKEVFQYVKDKVWNRLQDWRMKNLSRGGKEILLKTAAQAVPSYVMTVFLLPRELCKEIERMMNSFWWGSGSGETRGIRSTDWERLCRPKLHGGLGFRDLHNFNLAMLGKRVWHLLTQPNTLVGRLYKARYYPQTSILEANCGANPSYIWRSVQAAVEVVKEGARRRIGDGTTVSVWADSWLPDVQNGMVSTACPQGMAEVVVSNLMCSNVRSWDLDLINDLFNMRDRRLISQIVLSNRSVADGWYWILDDKGEFSVKSCYRRLQGELVDSGSAIWKRLWKLRLPAKVLNFLWRVVSGFLPTLTNLCSKRVPIDPTCSWCQRECETTIHVLLECDFARHCWSLCNIFVPPIMGHSLLEWFGVVLDKNSSDKCHLFAFICWRIWYRRNDWVWNQKSLSVPQIINSAGQLLLQWQKSSATIWINDADHVLCVEGDVLWSKPPSGWLKINVDAAFSSQHGRIGLGFVVRDEFGSFVMCKSVPYYGGGSAREAEGISMREALSWLKLKQLDRCILESDSSIVIDQLRNPQGGSVFHLIIEDCKHLASYFQQVQFRFIRRSANEVAHLLAKAARSMLGPQEWMMHPPELISSVLASESLF